MCLSGITYSNMVGEEPSRIFFLFLALLVEQHSIGYAVHIMDGAGIAESKRALPFIFPTQNSSISTA